MRKLLYSNGSPYARRVRVLLIEKGLDFESDVLETVRPIEDIKLHNPALQVPVLYDGERHLFGSNLILQYLYQEYTEPPSVPIDPPLAPAITRPERHWDDMLILTAIESMADSLVGVRRLLAGGEVDVPYVARQRYRIGSCLDWLEARIGAEGFWPGVFSVMDLNLMCPLLYGEKRGSFDFRTGQWPRIAAMVDRWQSRPSVAATPVNEPGGAAGGGQG
jgi:glutathione S-transferase